MEKSSVLDELASFDLSAPINVTVFIEESDDDAIINNSYEKANAEICKTTTYTHNTKDSSEDNRGCHQNNSKNSTNCKINQSQKLIEILNTPTNNQSVASNIAMAEMEELLKVYQSTNDIADLNMSYNNKPEMIFEIKTKKRRLFQVSMYLVNIISEFRKNCESLQKTSDLNEISRLKRQFLDKKYSLFNLSCNTVQTLILPHLNADFVTRFCRITHNWTKYWDIKNVKIEEIIFLFKELIVWAREKAYNVIKIGHNTNQQMKNQPNQLTLFNDGPVGHQVKISYQPTDTTVIKANPKFNNVQDNRGSMNENSLTKLPELLPIEQHNTNRHRNNLKRNYYHQTTNPIKQINQLDPSGNSFYLQSRVSNFNAVPTSQRDLSETGLVNKVRKPPPQMQFIASNNLADNLYTYEEMTNTKKLKTALKANEPTRSCVSTDSGIMSPINFDEMTSTQSTPTITHVTSLSPYAVLRQESQCAVCFKLTKNTCLGCCSRYYCCSLCQEIDWNQHKNFCFEQTAQISRV